MKKPTDYTNLTLTVYVSIPTDAWIAKSGQMEENITKIHRENSLASTIENAIGEMVVPLSPEGTFLSAAVTCIEVNEVKDCVVYKARVLASKNDGDVQEELDLIVIDSDDNLLEAIEVALDVREYSARRYDILSVERQ